MKWITDSPYYWPKLTPSTFPKLPSLPITARGFLDTIAVGRRSLNWMPAEEKMRTLPCRDRGRGFESRRSSQFIHPDPWCRENILSCRRLPNKTDPAQPVSRKGHDTLNVTIRPSGYATQWAQCLDLPIGIDQILGRTGFCAPTWLAASRWWVDEPREKRLQSYRQCRSTNPSSESGH